MKFSDKNESILLVRVNACIIHTRRCILVAPIWLYNKNVYLNDKLFINVR